MLAKDLLSNSIFALKKGDTCDKALSLMNEWGISHLPVVENDQPLGIVSSEDLSLAEDQTSTVETILQTDAPYRVGVYTHLFELLRIMGSEVLTCLVIIDGEGKFEGIVSARDVVTNFSNFSTFRESGAIITLEMPVRDYSLTEITRLIEYNSKKILGLYVNSIPNSTLLEIHIKLNNPNLKDVISTFERYGYKIKASYLREDDEGYFKDRYDTLMKYLDL